MSNKFKTLESFIGLGKADYHIHTNFSDGKPSIEEVLDYVEQKTDLDVIAISDHDTIEGAVQAKKLAEERNYRFAVVVGEEVSTADGHIVGLFLNTKIEPGKSTKESISEIKKQGGIAIASHPFQHTKFSNNQMITMDGIGSKKLYDLRFDIDGVETVNATPTLSDENLGVTTLNRSLIHAAETGGSDAHIKEAIGTGFTVFEGKTAEEFRTAIKNNQTQAIYGRWTILALLKYLYFFIPVGLRLLWHSIFNPNRDKS
ncbi:MAG: CehA/McbA family metallohydrolase [Patescibacteria group bacterium]|jgi:hypothetical protein